MAPGWKKKIGPTRRTAFLSYTPQQESVRAARMIHCLLCRRVHGNIPGAQPPRTHTGARAVGHGRRFELPRPLETAAPGVCVALAPLGVEVQPLARHGALLPGGTAEACDCLAQLGRQILKSRLCDDRLRGAGHRTMCPSLLRHFRFGSVPPDLDRFSSPVAGRPCFVLPISPRTFFLKTWDFSGGPVRKRSSTGCVARDARLVGPPRPRRERRSHTGAQPTGVGCDAQFSVGVWHVPLNGSRVCRRRTPSWTSIACTTL